MNRFLKKAFIFFVFLIVYFSCNGIINFYIYSTFTPNIQEHRILIIGDSHPECALNPNFFNDAQNISQSAEPYIITYWKLNKILDTIRPDTVLIGFAPHNISAFNDLKFSNEQVSSELFRRTYPIQDFKSIHQDITVDYIGFYKTLWKEICFFPKSDHFHFLGNFYSSDSSDMSNFMSIIKRHYFFNGRELGVSETAISHLEFIISKCESMGIQPILVSSPVHQKYYEHIPVPILMKFDELKNRFQSNGIIVIDKTKKFYPDPLYSDADHLNTKGAAQFTKEVITILGDKIMRQD